MQLPDKLDLDALDKAQAQHTWSGSLADAIRVYAENADPDKVKTAEECSQLTPGTILLASGQSWYGDMFSECFLIKRPPHTHSYKGVLFDVYAWGTVITAREYDVTFPATILHEPDYEPDFEVPEDD